MSRSQPHRLRLSRRSLLAGSASVGLAGAGVDVPLRPRLLVNGPAGSSSDVEARAFAAFLERHLPATEFRVVNLTDRRGLAAYQALSEAAADGLTLGWAATPNLPARSIDSASPDLMSGLRLIGAVQREPIVLVAPAGTASATGFDGIEAVRHAAASGDPIGTPPAGSPSHIAALNLSELLGVQLNLVTFPSAAAVRQAVLDGNVEAATMALGDALAALREGRMSGLGVAADEPAAAFPQMPTLRESGVDLVAFILRGIAVPPALPPRLADPIITALQAVTADPEFADQAVYAGFEVIWLDGGQWTLHMITEHSALSQLWQRSPWTHDRSG